MKFVKATYQKALVIGPYLQEKVGFEIEFDGSVESEQDALDLAKKAAEEWHIKNNPQVHSNSQLNIGNINTDPGWLPSVNQPIPVIDKSEERLEILIDNAATIDELRTYQSEAFKTSTRLTDQYIVKFNKLNNRK